jgi:tRNA-dihydrouridine synthase
VLGPVISLAPIDGVTDPAFRTVVHEVGPADLYFTEFYRAEHVTPERLLVETPAAATMPTILQLWGNNPDAYQRAARHAQGAGFVGVDVNLGCAVPKMLRKGYCAALIDRPDLVAGIVHAIRRGAPRLAVSVKTRLAATAEASEAWVAHLAKLPLDTVTIHFRRVSWDYRISADWSAADACAAILRARGVRVVGNGDLRSRDEAERAAGDHGLDGAMVGRAVMRNPCALSPPGGADIHSRSYRERLELLQRHIALQRDILGPAAYPRLKRMFNAYLFDDDATVARLYRADDHSDALASLHARAVAFANEKTYEAG